MAFDVTVFHFLNNFAGTSRFFDALVVFLAVYLPYALVGVLLLLVYFSAYAKRDTWYLCWTVMVSTVVARFGITEIIRALFHRPRPYLALPIHTIALHSQFYSDTDWSFPSGHSAFFFAMA